MEGTDQDSPLFPPNLLSESDWALEDFHTLVEVGKGKVRGAVMCGECAHP